MNGGKRQELSCVQTSFMTVPSLHSHEAKNVIKRFFFVNQNRACSLKPEIYKEKLKKYIIKINFYLKIILKK